MNDSITSLHLTPIPEAITDLSKSPEIPKPIGKHCLITIRDIPNSSILERIETIKPLFAEIVNACDLHVVSEAGFQFEPIGATYVYVLSESHMSIHTYPENNSAYMDIFCCNLSLDENKAYEIIKKFFNTTNLDTKAFLR
jgi:S-adenosylmethionine decarboxylase